MSELGEAKPRKSKWLSWVIGVVIALLVIAGALVAAEFYARGQVQARVQTMAEKYLGVPSGEAIELSYATPVLPQLIQGQVRDVSASASRVSLGDLSAALSFTAASVPLNDTDPIENGHLELWVDQAQLQALVDAVDTLPVSELKITENNVNAIWNFEVLTIPVPVGIELGVSAHQGQLLLNPDAFTMAGLQLNATELVAQLGSMASLITRPWPVCVADQLPAGISLSDVSISDGVLGVRFDMDPQLVSDPQMALPGNC